MWQKKICIWSVITKSGQGNMLQISVMYSKYCLSIAQLPLQETERKFMINKTLKVWKRHYLPLNYILLTRLLHQFGCTKFTTHKKKKQELSIGELEQSPKCRLFTVLQHQQKKHFVCICLQVYSVFTTNFTAIYWLKQTVCRYTSCFTV